MRVSQSFLSGSFLPKGLLIAASCLMLGSAPVLAQSAEDVEKVAPAATAKVKAKAKKAVAKGKNASEVVVLNARGDEIVAVTLTTAKGKTIAVVKKSLPAGKKHAMKLPGGSGCEFTVNARFADGTEFDPTPVNLCTDKTLRFTDGEAGSAPSAPAEE